MSEQKTDEWFAERVGHFTGSEIWKLMGSGRKKDEMFSETAKTYIIEKVAEILTDGKSQENKQVDAKATRWGEQYEPYARKCYQEFTFNKVVECGFEAHSERFGASPDGLVNEDGVLEIKCPFTSEKHIDHLLCKTPQDVFDVAPKYYYQMQAEIIATGRNWADFVSYDPRYDERNCLKVIRIPKDEAVCAEILQRVEAATLILDEIIQKIYS